MEFRSNEERVADATTTLDDLLYEVIQLMWTLNVANVGNFSYWNGGHFVPSF